MASTTQWYWYCMCEHPCHTSHFVASASVVVMSGSSETSTASKQNWAADCGGMSQVPCAVVVPHSLYTSFAAKSHLLHMSSAPLDISGAQRSIQPLQLYADGSRQPIEQLKLPPSMHGTRWRRARPGCCVRVWRCGSGRSVQLATAVQCSPATANGRQRRRLARSRTRPKRVPQAPVVDGSGSECRSSDGRRVDGREVESEVDGRVRSHGLMRCCGTQTPSSQSTGWPWVRMCTCWCVRARQNRRIERETSWVTWVSESVGRPLCE